ncbi:MAG TPA: hypothetical protein PLJ27_23860, partial [Polyangiaceae bacterium]|nr:hypothetical protein [Polyangiaceae bacterium]
MGRSRMTSNGSRLVAMQLYFRRAGVVCDARVDCRGHDWQNLQIKDNKDRCIRCWIVSLAFSLRPAWLRKQPVFLAKQ